MPRIGPRPCRRTTSPRRACAEAAARERGTAAGARALLLLGALLGLSACAPTVERPPLPAPTPIVEPASAPPDGDGDGFADGQDACPVVPGIAPDGCPEKDVDGDGFLDSVDRCPADPGVEPDGCPIPDSDGDGILDPDDACVGAPETKNGHEDDNGCPDEIPEDMARMTGPIRGIFFDLDRDTLRPASRPVLDRAVRVLQKYPKIRIEISGHQDSTGSVEYCKDISRRRANSVKHYLVEHGVDASRLETRGAGPDEPVDTNKTARGRARNRRIEFTILVAY